MQFAVYGNRDLHEHSLIISYSSTVFRCRVNLALDKLRYGQFHNPVLGYVVSFQALQKIW